MVGDTAVRDVRYAEIARIQHSEMSDGGYVRALIRFDVDDYALYAGVIKIDVRTVVGPDDDACDFR